MTAMAVHYHSRSLYMKVCHVGHYLRNELTDVTTANLPPTSITLSPNTYILLPPRSPGMIQYAPRGFVVGTLTATDENCCQSHTYHIVGGPSASLFNVSSHNQIVVNSDTLTGDPHSLLILVSDGAGGNFTGLVYIFQGLLLFLMVAALAHVISHVSAFATVSSSVGSATVSIRVLCPLFSYFHVFLY